jgi:hypothetical protein
VARKITIPVLFGPDGGLLGQERFLWSENCQDNGIRYDYCREQCCPEPFHCGVDVDTDGGNGVEGRKEPLFAVTTGVVKFADSDRFFCPSHVDIEPVVGPFAGERHIYGHMSQVEVEKGQTVVRGQRIGLSGDPFTCGSCRDWCAHVHWERRGAGDCSLDPVPVLTAENADGPGTIIIPTVTEFAFGDEIVVIDGGVRVRSTPAILPNNILDTLKVGIKALVIGQTGPVNADGFVWYNVSAKGATVTGWTAGEFWALVRHNALPNPP